MNKQELIKTLEEIKEHAKHSIEIDKYKSYWHGKTEAYVNAIGLAKQLEEPQKPVVPKFVAEWIEKMRKQLVPYHFESGARFMMIIGMDFHYGKAGLIDEKVQRWLAKDGNEVKLSDAIDYGYEVEKEPVYYVKDKENGLFLADFSMSGKSNVDYLFISPSSKVIPFTNKEKATAVALLVDGEVTEG